MADEKNSQNADGMGETVAIEFNLSDPDQLARQLDSVDLTEEESDQLLREAYKVNKQLKMVRLYADCFYCANHSSGQPSTLVMRGETG